MSERDLSPRQGLPGLLSRQPTDMTEEEKKKAGLATSIQRSPFDQITCRAGDQSCARAHESVLSRSTAAEPARAPDLVLNLQRQYGNRYVQRVLGISLKEDGEADIVSPETQQSIERMQGGGQQLDSGVRRQMGQALNADFSGVRVHTDSQADGLNRTLNARAFTTGQDIFFRQGEYRPGTSIGRQLLAHELTHVVQQSGDQVQTRDEESVSASGCACGAARKLDTIVQEKLTVSHPGDIYEQEADRTAQMFPAWEQGFIQSQGQGATAQRLSVEEEKKSGE